MISDIYDLSPIQAGMLFHRVFAPESQAYFDQFSCRLGGDVDAGRLAKAWQQLVDRHQILRTSFHWEGLDKPVQVVHAQVTLPWVSLDWRGRPPDEQEVRWTAYLEADRARGFDPDTAPLMRAAIVRLTDRDYRFCWSHHHLLLDGWCLTLVLEELFARYEALKQGSAPKLAHARPYSEYIKWLQQQDRALADRHWRDALDGFTAATPLPIARAAAGRAQADAVAEVRLSERLSADLRALAAARRLTLSTLAQGAWGLLLSRYSGTDDVVFGATVSGRPPELPGIETMLGVFINTVPVRLQVPEIVPAAEWLAGVQARHVAREPFAAIALPDIQKHSGVASGSPLFETSVIVMNYRIGEGVAGGAAGLEVSDVRIVDQTDIPLTLQVTPGTRTTLEILYDSARFDAAAVTRMLGHVEHLLSQFRDDLDRPLEAFEIVTPAERRQLLEVFNATAAPLDLRETVLDVWKARVAEAPDAIALACGGQHWSFRSLDEWSDRLAHGMRRLVPGETPLGTGDLVAIAFRRSERLVAAILAVWKCGAAYVPIDPDYPSDRIRQVIDTASPRLVLREPGTLDEALETALAGRSAFVSIDAANEAGRDGGRAPIDQPAAGPDLAYVIFTSGSTGKPKGAMVEHTGMLNHILAKIEDFGLDGRSIVVQNASHCFDISVWQCFAGILAGGRTVVYTDALVLDPQAFLDRVRSDRVTVLEVVPSYLAPLLDRFEDDPRPLPDLQVLLVTGETIKLALAARWFKLFPAIPMANAYGPTEASDDITHAIMRELPDTPSVPIGRPLRNFHIYIADSRMRLCPIGVPGELCVSGPGVGRGYLNDPVRTAAVFQEDPFREERGVRMYRTGDIGWFTDDGTLLLSGRKDYQVKVRGYRIELGDIEAALAALPSVRDAVVVDRRDGPGGATYLAAYVSPADSSLTGPRILEALSERLPAYMVPATCTVLAELPLTPNGKIDRSALPAPARGDQAPHLGQASPRTETERVLAGVWSEVLGIEAPGIHDNFFAAGGDSILSMQMVSRASRAGLALTPREIFQHQTIAELAAVARRAGPRPQAHAVSRGGLAPLGPAQRQFFDDVTVDRHHYNQSILLEVPAAFEAEHFAAALDAVVRHHDALRLRFTCTDGMWRQSVAPVEPLRLFEVHAPPDVAVEDRAAMVDGIGTRLQTTLDIERGPLVRAAYVDFGSHAPGRLLIVAHHLAVDGVSWRVLLEDLAAAYEAAGAAIALPPVAATYLEWAESQDRIETTPRALSAGGMRSDMAFDPARNTVESESEVSIDVDAATTRAFLTSAQAGASAGPTEVLLASAAMAIAGLDLVPADASGARRVAIDLETHGREGSVDVTRTVGWFTATFPVELAVPDDGVDPADIVSMARDQMMRVAAARVAVTRPPVLLNYHGRVDEDARHAWRLSAEPHGPARSPRQQREYLIEINAMVADGRLRVTIDYSRQLHRDGTMRALAGRLQDALASVVKRARGAAALSAAALGGGDVEDVYALSPTQQGLLFHGLVEETSGAYFNQLTCVLRGTLDVPAFQRAWRAAIDRHPALRTSFHWKGLERPMQAVRSGVVIPWSVDDWSGLQAGDQDRRWLAQGEEDRGRPFDLSAAPLMRCALARTGETSWRFRWSQHHLLLDGWSASIVLSDVLAAYDSFVRGAPFDAAAPPRFGDHIAWLERQDQGAAESFWRRHLEGFDSPTPLVVGQPEIEGRVRPGLFGEAELSLPVAFTSRLKSLAASGHITLNTLFQGVWSLLLGRYSGMQDVVFGSIASGRPPGLTGSDSMVGLFINTVPVRARLDDDAAVIDWMRALQRESAERDVHSYSSLADVQRWSGVAPGSPLFETILIFENYPVAATPPPGRDAIAIEHVRAFEPNNYPMTFVVTPGESIGLKIMFDAGRFDRPTIERALGHLVTLLESIAAAPGARLGALSILTDAERARIDAWNSTVKALPPGRTVLSLIEAHATDAPGRTAVVCDGASLTYGQLDAEASRIARRILDSGWQDRGEPEPRVVVLLRRSLQLPGTILALWKCGAVYVPLDPDYPAARITAVVADARPALVIADRREIGLDLVNALKRHAPVMLLDAAGGVPTTPGVLPDRAARPGGLAYVIYTSGSTGAPKGAMVEHSGLVNHVLSMIDDLALGPRSVVAQTASHCFDISMWQLFAALASGGTTAVYREEMVRRPAELAAAFAADEISIAQFVPSYLNVFLDAIERSPDAPALPSLVHMVAIGEALKPATVSRWFRRYPDIPLMNTYGPTEASDSVAHFDLAAPTGDAMVPIGRPIRNTALYVVDPAMRLCPVGVRGEICIGGAGVGRGYLFDEARTSAAFGPDPFAGAGRMYRTGDIGCYSGDGVLLFFGRRDHQVKVRGHRVELGEVESCLASLDGVRDAAVVTCDSGGGDLVMRAFVTAQAGIALDERVIARRIAERLPHHAVPETVRVLAGMPVMSNGKIDRRALESMEAVAESTTEEAVPGTETERTIAAIWAEVLDRARVGVDQSFFDLGGHSLKAIQIAGRLTRDLGVDVGVGDIFEHPTVARLSAAVDAMSAAAAVPLVALPSQPDYETSTTQNRIWLASRTPEGSAAYNMAAAFLVDGEVDAAALGRAFRSLVERHEALRTSFVIRTGSLRQQVESLSSARDVFRVTDMPDPGADEQLDRIIEDRIARPFDLSRAPLIDVEYLRFEDTRGLFIVRLHHIVGDAASIGILLSEALALYAAERVAGAGPALEPLGIQYRDFVAWRRRLAEAGALENSRRYWRDVLAPDMRRTGFTPDSPAPATLHTGAAVSDCVLDEALTEALRATARRHGATLFGAIVSAVYALLHRYVQHEDLVIGSTVSLRDHPLLERQVGCYIDTMVLRGTVTARDTAAGLLARASQICRDALAHRGYPFASIVDDLHLAAPEGKTPVFDVLVDYLPGHRAVGPQASQAGLTIVERRRAAEAAHVDVMFLAGESDDGATLTIQLVCNAGLFGQETVDLMRARLLVILRWLAADGETSLGGVDLLELPAQARRRLHIGLNTG